MQEDIQDLDNMGEKQELPLVHHGKVVGTAIIDPDDHTVLCKFDIKTLLVSEVIELFWISPGDRIELNHYTPIGEDA